MEAIMKPLMFSLRPLYLVCLLSLLLSLGCGPQGPMGVLPGGPLAGEVAREAVADWRFTDDDITVAIETRGRWFDHSVTVLAIAAGSHLYIPSREGFRKRWVKNVLEDSRVRIGVDGRIYNGRAKRVQDTDEANRAARSMVQKYLGLEAEGVKLLLDPPPPGDDRVDLWLFRIESAGSEP
jgi:hypothetical protein